MKMRNLKRLALCAPIGLLMTQMMACTTTGETVSNSVGSNASQYDHRHRNRYQVYAGAGIGLSRLHPDTSNKPGFGVDDRSGRLGQLTLGLDLSRQMSAEIHTANLGSAGVFPEGEVDYQISGLSGLFYAGKNRHNYKRRGLTGFGRLGFGMLRNSASGGIEVDTENSSHLLVGVGAEYSTRSGLGVRAEFVSYEEDANALQLALLYRFNRKQRQILEPVVQTIKQPVPIVPPVAAVAVVLDGDGDGVVDQFDRCLDSNPRSSVNADGCDLFSGVIEGVNFHSNSAELTTSAKTVLDEVSEVLKEYSSASVQVNAHTDSQGSEEHNQSLSDQRAQSVTDYLVVKGISRDRLTPNAYGELQPIASNDTVEGRNQNRRVELFATEQAARRK